VFGTRCKGGKTGKIESMLMHFLILKKMDGISWLTLLIIHIKSEALKIGESLRKKMHKKFRILQLFYVNMHCFAFKFKTCKPPTTNRSQFYATFLQL
jgi:hypothetical protein